MTSRIVYAGIVILTVSLGCISQPELVRVTENQSLDSNPSWSPDGRIAFMSKRNGNGDIFVTNFTSESMLIGWDSNEWGPSWSPDGRMMAFVSDRSGNQDIWILDVESGNVFQLTNSTREEWDPCWSPDGNEIAFVAKDENGTDIWITDLKGNMRRITWDGASKGSPSWARKIAFVSKLSGNFKIWTMNPDGSDLRQITAGNSTDLYPSWDPDGERIVFSSNLDGNFDLWIISDGKLSKLTEDPSIDTDPSWSRYGIAFVSTRSGNGDIYVLKV